MNMPTNETNQLIDIILNDGFKKFKDYWEINKKLLDNNIDKLKKLPIKIVYNSTDIALNKPYNLMKTDSLDNNNDDYNKKEGNQNTHTRMIIIIIMTMSKV